MLSPKRTKYRKYHRGRMRGQATRGNEICFGNFGLQALEPTWITSRQIEAARRTITRYTKRGAKLWIRIFPDKTVTARAAESRMGSGKGAVDYWVAVVRPGTILFEISSVPEEVAKAALNLAAYKLPLKTKFINKDNIIKTETELFNLRFKKATRQNFKSHEIKSAKRRLAQLKTLLTLRLESLEQKEEINN
jgi:large subunit ribosomal protein L16